MQGWGVRTKRYGALRIFWELVLYQNLKYSYKQQKSFAARHNTCIKSASNFHKIKWNWNYWYFLYKLLTMLWSKLFTVWLQCNFYDFLQVLQYVWKWRMYHCNNFCNPPLKSATTLFTLSYLLFIPLNHFWFWCSLSYR